MVSKAQAMSLEERTEILVQAIGYHEDDPNFPVETMKRIKGLVQGEKAAERLGIDDYVTESKIEASLIHYHSPYPQVRLLSTPFDTNVPVEPFRSYFLGLFWMAGTTAVNTFFSPRQPGISIGAPVLQYRNNVHPSGAVQALWAQGMLAAIPEPSTWAMLLLGFASMGFAGYAARARRTRRKRAHWGA